MKAMSELSPKTIIKKYLVQAKIMQLATVRNGQPWICSLHFASDDDSNIYWITKPTTRHSQDIEANAHVAIAIAVKTDRPLIGIQVEGTAEELTDAAVLGPAMECYIEHHGTDKTFADQIVAGTNEHKLYKFTPRRFSLYDEVNFAHQAPKEWVIDSN